MFANDIDTPIVDDPSLIKMKIKCKIADNYSKLGEVPGVLVDKVRRAKILKDLGHASTVESGVVKPEEDVKVSKEDDSEP